MEIRAIPRKTVTKMSSDLEKPADLSALEVRKILSPAAKRALAEAAERRAQAEAEIANAIEEGEPPDPDPPRYGE